MVKIAPSVIVISIFSSVLLVGFWVLIMPQIEQLLTEQQNSLQIANSSLAVGATKKTISPADIANQKVTKDQVLALIPPTDDQYNFTTQIESLSKNLGIPLTSYSTVITAAAPVSKPASTADDSSGGGAASTAKSTTSVAAPVNTSSDPTANLKKLTASMAITASYADVQKFIMAVQQLDRYVQVSQVILTSAATSDQVTATFTASAYYLPKA
jgi:Tfp pilus assembly protein PilO